MHAIFFFKFHTDNAKFLIDNVKVRIDDVNFKNFDLSLTVFYCTQQPSPQPCSMQKCQAIHPQACAQGRLTVNVLGGNVPSRLIAWLSPRTVLASTFQHRPCGAGRPEPTFLLPDVCARTISNGALFITCPTAPTAVISVRLSPLFAPMYIHAPVWNAIIVRCATLRSLGLVGICVGKQ